MVFIRGRGGRILATHYIFNPETNITLIKSNYNMKVMHYMDA